MLTAHRVEALQVAVVEVLVDEAVSVIQEAPAVESRHCMIPCSCVRSIATPVSSISIVIAMTVRRA